MLLEDLGGSGTELLLSCPEGPSTNIMRALVSIEGISITIDVVIVIVTVFIPEGPGTPI